MAIDIKMLCCLKRVLHGCDNRIAIELNWCPFTTVSEHQRKLLQYFYKFLNLKFKKWFIGGV